MKNDRKNCYRYLDRHKAMSYIGISDETLSIKVYVSGMKRVRDRGMKHISGMKHVTHLMTQ